jgi:hypothetical protein
MYVFVYACRYAWQLTVRNLWGKTSQLQRWKTCTTSHYICIETVNYIEEILFYTKAAGSEADHSDNLKPKLRMRTILHPHQHPSSQLDTLAQWRFYLLWKIIFFLIFAFLSFFGGGGGRQPPVGPGLLIHEVSRSHITTHHSR